MLQPNIETFIGCDSDYDHAHMVLYGAPFDSTTSFRPGARFGPSSMRHESFGLETYSPYQNADLTDCAVFDSGDLELCFGRAESALQDIEARAAEILEDGKFPLLLGGEHLVTLGAVRAMVKKYPDLHIVHFDAHADLRSQYEGSIYSHASVMHRAVADLGLPLAQFAMRDFCREEVEVRRQYNVLHYDADVLFRQGLPEQPLPADFPRRLYITFDVDGLDASLMPATGTPSPGGLFWHQALLLIERCLQGRSMVGMDVVELAPLPGLHHADFTAAKLTHALMGFAQRAGLPRKA